MVVKHFDDKIRVYWRYDKDEKKRRRITCYIDINGIISQEEATCSTKDTFVKAKGRGISLRRTTLHLPQSIVKAIFDEIRKRRIKLA